MKHLRTNDDLDRQAVRLPGKVFRSKAAKAIDKGG